jgi:hypothetical protein
MRERVIVWPSRSHCRISYPLSSSGPVAAYSPAMCSLYSLTNLDKSESRLRAFEFVVRQYALHYRVGLEEAKLALRPITLGAR